MGQLVTEGRGSPKHRFLKVTALPFLSARSNRNKLDAAIAPRLFMVPCEDANHAFDAPEFKTGFEAYGHWIEYNGIAADQSVSDVHAFLRGVFGN